MKIHILIPSVNSYGVMLLIALSIGSFPIARHIHIRWLKHYFSFVGSNAIVKSIIVVFGLLIIDLGSLFSWNSYREFYGLLIGVSFGLAVIFLESRLIRKTNREKLNYINHKINHGESHILRNAIITNKISLSSVKSIKAKGLTHVRQTYSQYADEPDFLNYSLISVVMVAIAEEFLFRGYMIYLAELTNNKMIMLLVILLSTFLFACSHMANAWSEFKCKLPLSILTMIGFLITSTLLSVIVTHVMLNVYAYFHQRKINFEKMKDHYLPVGVMR